MFIRLVINVYLSSITALLLNHSCFLQLFSIKKGLYFPFTLPLNIKGKYLFFLPTGYKPSFRKIKEHYELSLEIKKYGFKYAILQQ